MSSSLSGFRARRVESFVGILHLREHAVSDPTHLAEVGLAPSRVRTELRDGHNLVRACFPCIHKVKCFRVEDQKHCAVEVETSERANSSALATGSDGTRFQLDLAPVTVGHVMTHCGVRFKGTSTNMEHDLFSDIPKWLVISSH